MSVDVISSQRFLEEGMPTNLGWKSVEGKPIRGAKLVDEVFQSIPGVFTVDPRHVITCMKATFVTVYLGGNITSNGFGWSYERIGSHVNC